MTSTACGAWIGLEPPEFAVCDQEEGHEGRHQAEISGNIEGRDGSFQRVTALLTWEGK